MLFVSPPPCDPLLMGVQRFRVRLRILLIFRNYTWRQLICWLWILQTFAQVLLFSLVYFLGRKLILIGLLFFQKLDVELWGHEKFICIKLNVFSIGIYYNFAARRLAVRAFRHALIRSKDLLLPKRSHWCSTIVSLAIILGLYKNRVDKTLLWATAWNFLFH